jgi:hypothetical protein
MHLAHKVKDANGNAYNRTLFWQALVKMMQSWADYFDLLKTGGKVIQFIGTGRSAPDGVFLNFYRVL